MLDRQIDDFAAQTRFVHAVLGVLSLGDRVAELAAITRPDGGVAPPTAIADLLLGLISIRRTLSAVVTCDTRATADPGTAQAPRSPRDGFAATVPALRIMR